jgi:quinol monooxygenase YgiN
MSITVNILYHGRNGAARAFADKMLVSGTVAAIRAEEGNEAYEYYMPWEDPDTVLLVDRWRDQESLDAHHASPMMQKIAELRERYDLHMEVHRYADLDAPESDNAFIR